MTKRFFECPSLNGVLDGKMFLQNEPSMLVAYALQPQQNETVCVFAIAVTRLLPPLLLLLMVLRFLLVSRVLRLPSVPPQRQHEEQAQRYHLPTRTATAHTSTHPHMDRAHTRRARHRTAEWSVTDWLIARWLTAAYSHSRQTDPRLLRCAGWEDDAHRHADGERGDGRRHRPCQEACRPTRRDVRALRCALSAVSRRAAPHGPHTWQRVPDPLHPTIPTSLALVSAAALLVRRSADRNGKQPHSVAHRLPP